MEELLSKLEHGHHLDEAAAVDLPLMREWNLNLGHQANPDLHRLLGDDFALRLHWRDDAFAVLVDVQMRLDAVLGRAQLNDLILEDCVANFMASHLSEAINSGDLFVLNVELDLDMTAIEVLALGGCLRPTDDLQRVPHVRRDQKIARVDLE